MGVTVKCAGKGLTAGSGVDVMARIVGQKLGERLGRLEHDGSPVMAMCIGNLVARADRNGNISPDRENEHKLNDSAVALINAMARACLVEPDAWASVDTIEWV